MRCICMFRHRLDLGMFIDFRVSLANFLDLHFSLVMVVVMNGNSIGIGHVRWKQCRI